MTGPVLESSATIDSFEGSILPGNNGISIKGWRIETKRGPIMNGNEASRFEKNLGVFKLPEMVFGKNALVMSHEASGLEIEFNAIEALHGWTKENLPPVKVPAASAWMARNKPNADVIINYDYTYTTGYCGSEKLTCEPTNKLVWQETQEEIDWEMLKQKQPILFFHDVLLYEDELADCGISVCSVKVRVMPKCWFALLRFWLRVDGVLVRLRDTRVFSKFCEDPEAPPAVIRERIRQESTFVDLRNRGVNVDVAANVHPDAIYNLDDAEKVSERLVFLDS